MPGLCVPTPRRGGDFASQVPVGPIRLVLGSGLSTCPASPLIPHPPLGQGRRLPGTWPPWPVTCPIPCTGCELLRLLLCCSARRTDYP